MQSLRNASRCVRLASQLVLLFPLHRIDKAEVTNIMSKPAKSIEIAQLALSQQSNILEATATSNGPIELQIKAMFWQTLQSMRGIALRNRKTVKKIDTIVPTWKIEYQQSQCRHYDVHASATIHVLQKLLRKAYSSISVYCAERVVLEEEDGTLFMEQQTLAVTVVETMLSVLHVFRKELFLVLSDSTDAGGDSIALGVWRCVKYMLCCLGPLIAMCSEETRDKALSTRLSPLITQMAAVLLSGHTLADSLTALVWQCIHSAVSIMISNMVSCHDHTVIEHCVITCCAIAYVCVQSKRSDFTLGLFLLRRWIHSVCQQYQLRRRFPFAWTKQRKSQLTNMTDLLIQCCSACIRVSSSLAVRLCCNWLWELRDTLEDVSDEQILQHVHEGMQVVLVRGLLHRIIADPVLSSSQQSTSDMQSLPAAAMLVPPRF